MTQPANSREPSTEEILASIRRIIADDGPAKESPPNEGASREPPRAAPVTPTTPAPARFPPTDNSAPAMRDEEIASRLAELRKMQAPPASAEATERSTEPASEGLLSSATTAAIDAAVNTLAQTTQPRSGRTVEELVSELLRPMLKTWLDENLPALIERLVHGRASWLLVTAMWDANGMAEQWGRDAALIRLAYMKRHLERESEAEIERASRARLNAEQEDRLAQTRQTPPEPPRELRPQEVEHWRATVDEMKANDLIRDFDEFCAQVNKLDAGYTSASSVETTDVDDFQLALANFRAACERLARVHRFAAGRTHDRGQSSPAPSVA
jgi:uncharacterized protein